MCGRYVLAEPERITKRFKVNNKLPLYEPNYNVSPGTKALVVIRKSPNKCELLNWGFVPDWAEDEKYKPINARDDSLEKGFFKKAFLENRCLIPASGFYEWKRIEKDKETIKIPYFIRLKGQELFGMAGIYSERGFAIITTKPNSVMTKIHNRMPVIIEKKDEGLWLSGESDISEIKKLLQPIESEKMMGWRISSEVNSPKNNYKELLNKLSS
jgi:putative SOS response-associated peptidase YedK